MFGGNWAVRFFPSLANGLDIGPFPQCGYGQIDAILWPNANPGSSEAFTSLNMVFPLPGSIVNFTWSIRRLFLQFFLFRPEKWGNFNKKWWKYAGGNYSTNPKIWIRFSVIIWCIFNLFIFRLVKMSQQLYSNGLAPFKRVGLCREEFVLILGILFSHSGRIIIFSF